MIRKLILTASIVALLGGCKIVPEDVNRGELVASKGVRQMFDEENVDAVEAGERIRCERQRRVGTHLINRLCMTVAEWEEYERRIEEVAQNRLRRPCMPSQIASPAEPSIAGGRTADSGCGFGSVD